MERIATKVVENEILGESWDPRTVAPKRQPRVLARYKMLPQ